MFYHKYQQNLDHRSEFLGNRALSPELLVVSVIIQAIQQKVKFFSQLWQYRNVCLSKYFGQAGYRTLITGSPQQTGVFTAA
jgi:hypothetical protein